MKRLLALCIAIGTLTMFIQSCDDPLGIKDCSTIGLLLDIKKTVDTVNVLTVDFEVLYGGQHALGSTIEWDYGDGTGEIITGRMAQHTYSSSGTYQVVATVTLTGSDIGTCPKEINQQVIL